jgi:sugar/nucleoside kinase (ribokinase family)
MPGSIVTIGEILVEIMATTPGQGFREPIALLGPFPSGAPAIFIDQIARLGWPCAIVGCVGDDDFGHLNLDRLRRDGVDVSAVAVHPSAVTGSAFVRYREDGRRDFVFNIAQSANGLLVWSEAAKAVVEAAGHLHITGSSLGTPAIAEVILSAIPLVRQKGGTISFDPNVRSELLRAPGLRSQFERILSATDLFLPSDSELLLLSDATTEDDAIKELLARGVGAIVHKQGANGARYVDRQSDVSLPAFRVGTVVDATGAGDIFGATFITGWLGGLPPAENLRRAVAAGAIAVMRKGPMEGVSTPAEIDAFLADAAAEPTSPAAPAP